MKNEMDKKRKKLKHAFLSPFLGSRQRSKSMKYNKNRPIVKIAERKLLNDWKLLSIPSPAERRTLI